MVYIWPWHAVALPPERLISSRMIDASTIPEILAFNKSDLMSDIARHRLENLYPDGVLISARNGAGLPHLAERISDTLKRQMVALVLEVPYARGDIIAAAHRVGEVLMEKHDDQGTIIEVRVPQAVATRFLEFTR